MNLIPRKDQPQQHGQRSENSDNWRRFPVSALNTASAMVKLLQIRTAVLMEPSTIFMSALPAMKAARIRHAIHRKGQEQAAEQHHFGHDENPHPERGGFALLLGRAELLAQHNAAGLAT